jgi:uncharacterized protein (TIGR02231 family)
MNFKNLIFILFTFQLGSTLAQNEIVQSTSIKDVTVFLSGAEIHRTAKVNLAAGSNTITFDNLSNFITPSSIQVKAKNSSVTIASVNIQSNYLIDNSNDKRLNIINDSIEELKFSIAIREGHKRVYTEEKSLLLANKSIRGETNGVETFELQDMADFFRKRLLDLETKMLDIDMQIAKINKVMTRLLQQQKDLKKGKSKYTKEIVVNASSSSKTTTEFELTYIVTQASWIPKYDLRSNDITEPVALTYKADVYNLSGYDWKNVNITLSTGNPSVDNTQPTLTPTYISFYQNFKDNNISYAYGGAPKKMKSPAFDSQSRSVAANDEMDKDLKEEESLSIADFTQVVQSNVNTEFKIKVPYTIDSDGKPYLVEIQKHELPVNYSYLSIPKKDGDAFLLARVTGWENYNLLPGEANVYFEETFVGTSYLETASTKDTLDISLGRDKSIVVTRKKVDEFCKNNSIGSNKRSTRGYEIEVRNNKSKPITIDIYDQIPLSNKKEIEVIIDDLGKASHNETTGELKWKLTLQSGETRKLVYKFQVKYPKDYNLTNF